MIGVTYWFDPFTRLWQAYGRADIQAGDVIPDPDPVPTSGYGSNVYGSKPYGSD